MESAPRLYDCHVTYHLVAGHNLSECFRQDIPEEVWKMVMEEWTENMEALVIHPATEYAKVLLPKSNISYISMKISPVN